MEREGVAEAFEEIAALLVLAGENPHRARAYENAARHLGDWQGSLQDLVEGDRLDEIRGLGGTLREKVIECHRTGRLELLETLRRSVSPGLVEMLELPGLGPKKIRVIHESLGIDTVESLEAACREGRVESLPRFGRKSQDRILDGILFRRRHASLHLHSEALGVALPMLERLREHGEALRCSLAGSLRRNCELVGNADLLVSSSRPGALMECFTAQPEVESVLSSDTTRSSVITRDGLQVDLRVVSDARFPFALAHFTGSREHNIAMREQAGERNLRLDESGLFPTDSERSLPCDTEEDIFSELGLDWIPPELREDRGEFTAARNGTLPRLLEWTQLRGSLHNHSDWSDGRQTLEQIIDMCLELGCDYWAITDHSRASFQANGLHPDRLRRQLEVIGEHNARLEERGESFRLLSGTEVDILADGRLDFDDELLASLDVVVASLHQPSLTDEARNTRRLIRAARNPHVHMLGHLTGRLLLRRQPYPVDRKAIIDVCSETGTWIELNASPWRCDLDWRLWPYARERGVRCVVNCDAHGPENAAHLRTGTGIARKGWLTAGDVINTLPLDALRSRLSARRQ